MKTILAAVAFTALSFTVYLLFYDILIPGLPNGSYRLAVGNLFAVPSLLLALGQVGIGALIILFVASSLGKEKLSKNSFAKSLLVASLLTFLFSLTYVIYPFFGPFYYIIFSAGGVSPFVLVGEIVWTAVMLAAGTMMIGKLHKLELKRAFAAAALAIVFIMVAAS